LLGKWRYSIGSDTPACSATAAIVTSNGCPDSMSAASAETIRSRVSLRCCSRNDTGCCPESTSVLVEDPFLMEDASMTLSEQLHVNCPPAMAFDLFADVRNITRWNDGPHGPNW
jgi:hypothetical protein